MKNRNVNLPNSELQAYVLSHNPLLIRNPKGALLYFENFSTCYYSFIVTLYLQHAKGYCDPVLWIVQYFRVSLQDAERMFNTWRTKFKFKDEPFMIVWNDKKEAAWYCKFFVQGVSYTSGASFVENLFNVAFDKFFEEYYLSEHLKTD